MPNERHTEVQDRSGNLLVGFPTTKRAIEYVEHLQARDPSVLTRVRVIAFDDDGDEYVVYPS